MSIPKHPNKEWDQGFLGGSTGSSTAIGCSVMGAGVVRGISLNSARVENMKIVAHRNRIAKVEGTMYKFGQELRFVSVKGP